MNEQENQKRQVALKAVEFVKNGNIVGLGTGSTATFAIEELGKRFREGLKITGVASSLKTEVLAKSFGIPMLELGETEHIDISIDGADEFTEQLDLIKGGGGALFREKVVASLSKNQIIITDASKKVEKLGAFKVPVEVTQQAYQYVLSQLEQLSGRSELRKIGSEIFITDNQNYIVDVDFGMIENPGELASQLDKIVGVFEHGIFVNLTAKVLMAKDGEIVTFQK